MGVGDPVLPSPQAQPLLGCSSVVSAAANVRSGIRVLSMHVIRTFCLGKESNAAWSTALASTVTISFSSAPSWFVALRYRSLVRLPPNEEDIEHTFPFFSG
jgi:hypothetical protein